MVIEVDSEKRESVKLVAPSFSQFIVFFAFFSLLLATASVDLLTVKAHQL